MNQLRRQAGTLPIGSGLKWLNSPVTIHQGTLETIRSFVPDFERRAFTITGPGSDCSCPNERRDVIVRKPFSDDPRLIAVGTVSKGYALLQHAEVLDVAAQALRGAGISPESVRAELRITEYGERMALSLSLPDKHSFDPGDGHPLALRLECFNSVDGSTRLLAVMGWFRFVCSNGLVVGVTRSDLRRRHVGGFSLHDVEDVLCFGMRESEEDKENLIRWRQQTIEPEDLAPWVENDVRKNWGYKAAARVYHIARMGHDVEILSPYKGNSPVTVPVRQTKRVPGAPETVGNLYDVSQILAWLAKERRDVQEQLEWREAIPGLLETIGH